MSRLAAAAVLAVALALPGSAVAQPALPTGPEPPIEVGAPLEAGAPPEVGTLEAGPPLTSTPVPQAAPGAATEAPLVWTLTLSTQQTYESNVLYGFYLGPDQSTGDYLTRFNGSLGRSLPLKRGRLSLTAEGGGAVYQDVEDLNRFTWGLKAAGGYSFTRRLSIDGQVSSALGYVRDFVRLDPNATVAPYTPARFDDGTATLRFLASRDTVVHLDARGQRYVFEDATPLTNGKNFVLGIGVDHAFGSGSRLSGIGEYERTEYGPMFAVERVLGRWDRSLGRGWAARFDAGVGRYRAISVDEALVPPGGDDPTEPHYGPILRVAISGRQGRHSFRASASRNVGQNYGYGTVGTLTDVGIAYGVGPIHGVTFVATADGSRSSDAPLDVPPDGLNLGARLEWRAARHFSVGLEGYRWSRHGGTVLVDEAPWSGWAVSLFLAYDVRWR